MEGQLHALAAHVCDQRVVAAFGQRLARRVDRLLVDALARAGAACFGVSKQARADNDFEAFLPSLTTVFDLTREASVAMGLA